MKLTGEWSAAARLLSGAGRRVSTSIDQALRQEALYLKTEIVRGLRDQNPGGAPMRPLAETTLTKRAMKRFRGTKALIEKGDLLRSVTASIEHGVAFVGVNRKARTKTGEPVVDLARRNEFGAPPVVIPLTDKSRRFLFALLARTAGAGGGAHGAGAGVVVIRTPARPFLRPAFEVARQGASARFLRRVAQGFFR